MSGRRTIATVGNFDGVHAGHRAIVSRAVRMAEELGARGGVVVLAFDPHPLSRLDPGRAPARLTTFERRSALLLAAGAADVRRLEPDAELLGLSPEDFIRRVVEKHNAVGFVEGEDFRFGKGRAGSVETLRSIGESVGFCVETVSPVAAALSDHTVVTASSTMVRWLVERGRVRDAWAVLGRPYELAGTVVRGDRRGRDLGYPTANLETPLLLPADGVYGAVAELPDGRRHAAALSVGTKPMFDGEGRTAEAFLLDAPREEGSASIAGLPEYGWELRLEIVGWVREQLRLDSVATLIAQMGRDCAGVRRMVEGVRGTSRETTASAT